MKINKKSSILKIVKQFIELRKDKNHRFRSWEHCHKKFGEYLDDKIDNDEVSLN